MLEGRRKLIRAMHHFRGWAIEVAIESPETEWAMLKNINGRSEVFFSLEGYNYFAKKCSHIKDIRAYSCEHELESELNRHKEHLYSDNSDVKLAGTKFFRLPDKFDMHAGRKAQRPEPHYMKSLY